MLANLFNQKLKKNILQELTVEYSLKCDNLMVVLYKENETCRLYNERNSSNYNLYSFRKIHHIIGATTNYEGAEYSLTLGFILTINGFEPIIINQHCSNEAIGGIFGYDHKCGELYFDKAEVFNYKEYVDVMKALSKKEISFSDFVNRIIKGHGVSEGEFTFYDLTPGAAKDLSGLSDSEEFDKFLNAEEMKVLQ